MIAITHATTPVARRGIRVLLANSFLMIFGYFTIISVFALHFKRDLRFTAAMIGLALALRSLTQQGLDIFGGAFADRVGFRASISLGCMIRVMGFLGMGFAQTLPQLLIACFIAGFGGMFFDAAGSAALAALLPVEDRQRTFALQATLNNVAAAIGPVLGIAVFARFGFRPVAFLAAAIFLWIGLQTYVWLPQRIGRASGQTAARSLPLQQVMREIFARRAFVWVVLLQMGFWALTAQITLTAPLAAAHLSGASSVAVLLGLNALLAIPLQYPLVRLVERRMSAVQLLGLSMLLSGVGLAMFFVAPDFTWEIIGICIATIGGLAVGPTMASITAQIAPPRALAAFYGFSAIGVGVGGAIGQYFGGSLFDLQRAAHLPWLMAVCLAALTAVITYALWRAPSPTTAPAYVQEPAIADLGAESGIVPSPLGG
jgi:DHA1 family multidrug resistance protein-like MFS transporter